MPEAAIGPRVRGLQALPQGLPIARDTDKIEASADMLIGCKTRWPSPLSRQTRTGPATLLPQGILAVKFLPLNFRFWPLADVGNVRFWAVQFADEFHSRGWRVLGLRNGSFKCKTG